MQLLQNSLCCKRQKYNWEFIQMYSVFISGQMSFFYSKARKNIRFVCELNKIEKKLSLALYSVVFVWLALKLFCIFKQCFHTAVWSTVDGS